MKNLKKLLALLLTVSMLTGLLGTAAFAADPETAPVAEPENQEEVVPGTVEKEEEKKEAPSGETGAANAANALPAPAAVEEPGDENPLGIPAPGSTVDRDLTIDAGAADVTIENVTFAAGATLTVNTSGTVTLKGCTFEARTEKTRNARVLLNAANAVVTGNSFGDDVYNVIEFSQKGNALSSAEISDNIFGTAGNNYISAYLFEESAVVTVSGNTFTLGKEDNDIVRISNYDKTADVTINVSDNTINGTAVDAVVLFQKTNKHNDAFAGVKLNVTKQSVPEGSKLSYVYAGDKVTDTTEPIVATDTKSDASVAEAGGKYYTSLQAAIDAADAGDTVTMLADYTEGEKPVVSGTAKSRS